VGSVWRWVIARSWTTSAGSFIESAWGTRLTIGESDSPVGLLLLYEDIANIVSSDMDGVGDPGDAKNTLGCTLRYISSSN